MSQTLKDAISVLEHSWELAEARAVEAEETAAALRGDADRLKAELAKVRRAVAIVSGRE